MSISGMQTEWKVTEESIKGKPMKMKGHVSIGKVNMSDRGPVISSVVTDYWKE